MKNKKMQAGIIFVYPQFFPENNGLHIILKLRNLPRSIQGLIIYTEQILVVLSLEIWD